MAESMRELLNSSQLNSLVIALRMFEEQLRRAEASLEGDLPEGVLYQYTRQMPPERISAALAEIAAALQAIATLARDLDATPASEPIEARVAAALNISWANLCDVKSARLVRYGTVDDALGGLLDSRIDALARQALYLATLFGNES